VLKQLPCRVFHSARRSRSQLSWEILDGAIEIRVRLAALYQLDQLFP
jgi:hypothetical protein